MTAGKDRTNNTIMQVQRNYKTVSFEKRPSDKVMCEDEDASTNSVIQQTIPKDFPRMRGKKKAIGSLDSFEHDLYALTTALKGVTNDLHEMSVIDHDSIIDEFTEFYLPDLNEEMNTRFKEHTTISCPIEITKDRVIMHHETFFFNKERFKSFPKKVMDATTGTSHCSISLEKMTNYFLLSDNQIHLRTYLQGVFSIVSVQTDYKLNIKLSKKIIKERPANYTQKLKEAYTQSGLLDFMSPLKGLSKLNDVCDRIQSSVLPDAEASAETLKTILDRAQIELNKVSESSLKREAENFIDIALRKFGLSMKAGSIKIISFALFSSALVDYINGWTSYSTEFLIISTVVLLFVWSDDISSIFSAVASLFNEVSQTKKNIMQIGGLETIITSITTCLIGLSLKGEKFNHKMAESALKQISSFDRIKKNFTDIFKYFIELFCTVADYTCLGQYIPTAMRYAYIAQDEIVETCHKIDQMTSLLNKHELTIDYENYQLLKTMDEEVEKHIREMPRGSANAGIIQILTDQRKNVRTLIKVFETRFTKNIRQEPVCIILRGGPGTLKSQALQHISHAFIARTVPDALVPHAMENPAYYMYNRTPEQKYWDGYRENCSLVTYQDDFGQTRDVVGEPDSEAMNVIRMINSLEANLHMADLTGKGNTRFTSKLVVLTTNAHSFDFQSIIETKAVLRRFDFGYSVVPKEEYCMDSDKSKDFMSRRIDMSKLPIGEQDVSSVHPRCLDFWEYDYATGKHTGVLLNFEEIVEVIISKEKLKRKWYDQNEIELKKTVNEQILKRSSEDTLGSEPEIIDLEDLSDLEAAIDWDIRTMKNDIEIIPAADQLMEKNLYYSKPSNHIIRRYLDKCLDVLSWSGNFSNYNREVLLTLLIANEKSNLLPAIKFNCMSYLRTLVYKTKEDFEHGWPRLKGKMELFCDKIKESFKTFFSSFFSSVGIYLLEFKKWVSNNANLLMIIAGVSTFVAIVSSILVSFLGKKEAKPPDIHAEVVLEKGDYHLRSRQTFHVVHKTEGSNNFTQVTTQMGSVKDTSGYEQVMSKLLTNMYTLSRVTSTGSKLVGYVTFVEGRTCVMNYHFIAEYRELISAGSVDPKGRLVLSRMTKGESGLREFNYTVEEFINLFKTNETLQKLDLSFAYLEKIPPHSVITKMFPTIEEENNARTDFCMILNKNQSEVSRVSSIVKYHRNVINPATQIIYYNVYEYLGYTEEGDCGSWLHLCDKTARAKLFGIHVAGDRTTGIGYATPINQSIIEIGLNLCGNRIIQDWPIEIQTQMGNLVKDGLNEELFCGKFDIVAQTDLPNTVVSKTKLMKTPVYGAWGKPLTIPCKLNKFTNDLGQVIDPFSKNIIKFCKPDVHINNSIVQSLEDSLYDFLLSSSKVKFESRILTFEEAISGIKGDEFYSGISVKTSPGYPYNMDRTNKFPGKSKWFTVNTDGSYDLSSGSCAELKSEVLSTIDQLKKGNRPLFIFADNLKDETRPLEKVMDGKTRIFASCPLVYFIIVRMYFGTYQSWYMWNNTDNGSALGVNPFSQAWDRIAREMIRKCPVDDKGIGAGDYSSFDGSQLTQLQNSILSIINKIYGDDHSFIRTMLWLEVTASNHIKGSTIYSWQGSLPSGHPLTPIINCMYNHLSMRYCWYRANDNNLLSLWEFHHYVFLIVLGDDNLFSVSEQFREIFNESTIGPFMREINLVYTPENKEAALSRGRSISSVGFLKRGFRYETVLARFVAPLEISTILETPYWCNSNPDILSITKDLIQSTIDELSLHGKDVFNEHIGKIVNGSVERMNFHPERTCWIECINRVSQREAFF